MEAARYVLQRPLASIYWDLVELKEGALDFSSGTGWVQVENEVGFLPLGASMAGSGRNLRRSKSRLAPRNLLPRPSISRDA